MLQWHLEKRLIKELKPHPKNPRQLSKDQERHLRTSIDKFGLAEKIIINTDNTIIGGHQRISILKSMKHKEVDCWVPDKLLDEHETDELCIRLNKNTGDWEWDELANNFDVPDLLDWGFLPGELELHLDDIQTGDKEPKEKKMQCCPKCGHEY